MKKVKRVLLALLVLLMSISCLLVTVSAEEIASGTCGDNLTWFVTSDGALYIRGTGVMYDYTYNNSPWHNYNSDINKIVIGKGVTSIGQYAFYGCEASSVSIPNTVKSIGYEAFWYSGITSVEIPASVTNISSYAFESCYSLTSVRFLGDAPSFGSYVFSGVAATVYYPRDNSSWSNYIDYNMGGVLTWIPKGKLVAPVVTIGNNPKTGKITLSWESVAEAVKYVVYRSESKNGEYKKLTTVANATSVTNISAVAGKTYYYKVQAIAKDSEFNSEMSNRVFRTCDLARPSVTASNIANTGKIKLSWKKVDGALAYKIYYSTTGEDGSFKTLKSKCSNTSITHSSAKAGVTYYYKVKALAANDSADSVASTTVKRVCDCAPPVVKASNDPATGKNVLTWKAVSGATGYKVYRADKKNGDYDLKKTVVGSTNWTDTKALAGVTYYYKVKAIAADSSANSTYSSVVNRICDCAQPKVKVSNSSTSYIKISWEKVVGAEKYVVYRATSKGGTYKKLTTTTAINLKNTSVKAGQTYYYKVKALSDNSSANSVYSDVIVAKAALKAPSMKTSATVTSSTIKISWEKVSGADGYYVYRRASTSDSWKRVKTITSSSTTSFKDTERSGRYYYCVAAYKTVSGTKYTSLKSDAIRVRTLAKPSGMDAYANDNETSNTCAWNQVKGATGYQIYYKVGSNGSWKKLDTVTNATSCYHFVDHGKYYYYKVRAIYKHDGVTSYGTYAKDDYGIIHYYYPNVTTWMSSKTDASTGVFMVNVTNNGVAPIYFYGDGARTVDYDYSTWNRDLTMVDYEYFNNYGLFKETEYTKIQPGESKWVLLLSDKNTWYDSKTRVVMDVFYDGMWYTTYTSSNYGLNYYLQ